MVCGKTLHFSSPFHFSLLDVVMFCHKSFLINIYASLLLQSAVLMNNMLLCETHLVDIKNKMK